MGRADGACVSDGLLTIEKGALWREREEEEQEGRGNKSARWGRIVYFFKDM